MTRYAVEIPVSELRIGDEIVTREDPVTTRVKASTRVKSIDVCHGDSYGRYAHVNSTMCYTVAGKVRIASEQDSR